MAGTAPFEVVVSGSDDETFTFAIPFESTDGSAFPFEDYAIEYVLTQNGETRLRLIEGNGITVTPPVVTFRAARGTLSPGQYEHGCRIRSVVSGDEYQIFDGLVTISEGHFS